MRLSKEKREELKALAEKALIPDSMERHGDGLTLYCGRDDQHHGLNLANEVDPRFGHWALASRQALPDALADLDELESKLADAVKALEVAIGIAYENGVDFTFYGFKCDDDAEQLCRATLAKLRAK